MKIRLESKANEKPAPANKNKQKEIKITNNFDERIAAQRKKEEKDKPNPKKKTILWKDKQYNILVHHVEAGEYPLGLAEKYQTSIDELKRLNSEENKIILETLGIYKPTMFSQGDKLTHEQYWIKEKGYAWNIDPLDQIIVSMEIVDLNPKQKTQPKKKAPNKENTPKYREADKVENWLKYHVSPDEIARMLDTFGEDRILTLAKQGDTQELVKVIYQLASEQKYPGGVKNPLHPVNNKTNAKLYFELSKDYKGLYKSSGGNYYHADEHGLHNVPWEAIENNTWQKYVKK